MSNSTTNELPTDFDPSTYDSIPWGNNKLFDQDSTPELESLGKELIRKSLEKKLGKPVVSRDIINHRYGLKRLGFSDNDIMNGKVLVR